MGEKRVWLKRNPAHPRHRPAPANVDVDVERLCGMDGGYGHGYGHGYW